MEYYYISNSIIIKPQGLSYNGKKSFEKTEKKMQGGNKTYIYSTVNKNTTYI